MLNKIQKKRVILALQRDPRRHTPTKDTWQKNISNNPPLQTIPNKDEYYAHYEACTLGNKPLTWYSLEEIKKSGWTGRVCMRSKVGISRKKVEYDIPLKKVHKRINAWKKAGIPENEIAYNQSMPNHHLSLQGEVMKTQKGLYLICTTIKEPMLKAFEKERINLEGLNATRTLKGHLWPSSHSDLIALMDMFPESVVEFSAYTVPVGNIQGRNTIIWEVRNY